MDLVGQNLGQFQIIEELGKGGMATVYKAYQPNLRRYVAIKVLLPTLAEDLDLVKRFLREARSAAAFHHPNVIVVHDVGSEGNIHYIVSEYLEGCTLGQLLKESGALPQERVLKIARQIAAALDYAHSRGFIHRDIKPSNIMVDPDRDDHVTLMDFGLVWVAGGSQITRTGFIMGTPDYMSPEQAKGEAIDHRTDIYSLGVTLYHMLTGEVPFNKPTPHAVLMAHILEEPPSMSLSERQISPQIDGVVRKCMAKEVAARYEWSGDMVHDLELAISNPAALSLVPPPEVVPGPPAMPSLAPATSIASAPATGPITHRQTPAPGAPAYRQTPPPGPPLYSQTPSGGTTPYPQASPVVAVPRARPRWIWPVMILSLLGTLAVLVIVGILVAPSVLARIPAFARMTLAAQTATAVANLPTVTPQAVVRAFEVSPREIAPGESVTISWRVDGVTSVAIRPDVGENLASSGSVVRTPAETTVYELVLPDGASQTAEVTVSPRPAAPVIERFEVQPAQQVRNGTVELFWRVKGETTTVEITTSSRIMAALPAEGSLSVVADQTSVFVLVAYNGPLSASKAVELKVIGPTVTLTVPAAATSTATVTPTQAPPTATPTQAPPTATPLAATPTATRAVVQATRTPTSVPSSGALVSFEQWGSWRRGDQPYGELTQTQEQARSGKYAAKLSYSFPEAADDFVVFTTAIAVSGKPNTLHAWVYGDGSGHFLSFWIQDAAGQVWSVHMGQVGEPGWHEMAGAIDPGRPWPSGPVSGPDNGVIDYPIRFYGIVLDRPDRGPLNGQIYIDDISAREQAAGTPVAGTMPTTEVVGPGTGGVGRIILTVRVGESYALYSADPSWDKMVKIGDTDQAHSTCATADVASTPDGTVISLRPLDRCAIAGTVGSCTSPNGQYKANTNRKGTVYQVTLWRVSDNKMMDATYEGPLNIHPGLNWAPDSSHFLFTVDQSVYRADVGTGGYHRVIPFKEYEWPVQYTADGTYVFYPKPVNGAVSDVFLAYPDGTGERNLTHAPIAVKMCPRWRK